VFVFGQSHEEATTSALVRHDYHESACFKERQLFLGISQRVIARHVVALNAGVMRRFERVVALPDPKILNFPSRNSLFRLQFRPADAIE
jgi:hypothetical protein